MERLDFYTKLLETISLSGVFIVVVMTGLDQDMMQKNLTCKSLKRCTKKICALIGFAFLPTNILFMGLGILLITFFQHKNIPLPTSPDELMLYLIANGILGNGVEILFTIRCSCSMLVAYEIRQPIRACKSRAYFYTRPAAQAFIV